MSLNFWHTEEQLYKISRLLPNKPCGVACVDDRRVLSGIIIAVNEAIAVPMCRRNTAPPRLSTTAGSVGCKQVPSNMSSMRWRARRQIFLR